RFSLAPDSFARAQGTPPATQPQGAAPTDYPTVLAGSSVAISDFAGALRLGALSFVSPGQINYVLPAPTAIGLATVTVTSASGATSSGTVQIARVAPGLFQINTAGVAAATAVRVNPDSSQTPVTVFQCGTTAESCVPAPIDPSKGPGYLTLYGTGIRNRTSLANVRTAIG